MQGKKLKNDIEESSNLPAKRPAYAFMKRNKPNIILTITTI